MAASTAASAPPAPSTANATWATGSTWTERPVPVKTFFILTLIEGLQLQVSWREAETQQRTQGGSGSLGALFTGHAASRVCNDCGHSASLNPGHLSGTGHLGLVWAQPAVA